MQENKFKIGDKVRIRTSVTLDEIRANSYNGCQNYTMMFLLEQSSGENDFNNTFKIENITPKKNIKLKNVDGVLNQIIFEKVEEKEMTIEEISKILGYDIKIVKENK